MRWEESRRKLGSRLASGKRKWSTKRATLLVSELTSAIIGRAGAMLREGQSLLCTFGRALKRRSLGEEGEMID